MSHQCQFRVYYEDTDAGGVVYYANYLRFAERARTEWLRELGFHQSTMWQELSCGIVVANCSIAYKKPAKLDDLLTIESQLQSMSKARMSMVQKITCESVVLAEIDVDLACVNQAIRPLAWPEPLVRAFSPFEPSNP